MDMNAMDDDVSHVLNCDASSVSNVNVGSTSINCLEAVHYKLFLQFNHHVTLENNPERFFLDDCMTKGPWPGVNWVIITRVCNDIEATIFATNSIPSKSNTTVSQAFTVFVPVGITTPAVINRIACST
ncbi:unnamed protein product [Amaranthus hypochondriacus]